MRKILLKFLFAVLLVSGSAINSQTALPGTIEVETGDISNSDVAGGRPVVGDGNGGTSNVLLSIRRSSGKDAEIINNVTIASDGNYDFTFTYYKTPTTDAPVTISSTASDGSGATVLASFGLPRNSNVSGITTSNYGTFTVANVPLTTSINYITINNTSTPTFDLDNIVVTQSPGSPLITSTKNGDWNDPTVWTVSGPVASVPSTTPTAEYDVIIDGHRVTVPPGLAAECNNLTIQGSGSREVNINETASLTVSGNFESPKSRNGLNFRYTATAASTDVGSFILLGDTRSASAFTNRRAGYDLRVPNNNNWHLVYPPNSSGQSRTLVTEAANTFIPQGTSDKDGVASYAMGSYNNGNAVGEKYDYIAAASVPSGNFPSQGYATFVNNAGDAANPNIRFDPIIPRADEDFTLVGTGDQFNLIGNPYFAYLPVNTAANATNLLSSNSTVLAEQTIWVWNSQKSGGAGFEAFNLGDAAAYSVPAAQGFFVKSVPAGGTFVAPRTLLTHTKAGNFLKSTANRFELELQVSSGKLSRDTEIRYTDGMTNSFDNGYDSSTFSGDLGSAFAIYTQIVDANSAKDLAIQSLPTNYDELVVPVGVNVVENKEYTFSANIKNLPEGISVFLEDRVNNTFTDLSQVGAEYSVSLSGKTEGRFFLHTKSSALSTTNLDALNGVKIYGISNSTLRVAGLTSGNATLKLVDILGKEVFSTNFTANSISDIQIPNVNVGVYIVQLQTTDGNLNRKIVLE